MEHNKTINVQVGRCNAELEVEFNVTPGMGASWDDAGWGAELDGYSFEINRLTFDSGSIITYDWLQSRGLADFAQAVLNEYVSYSDVQAGLGDLDDYQHEYRD